MTKSVQGRSLQLYFIDGRPDGMLTAEVFNWTGHVLVAPRTRIADALKRQEAGYTGVYILLGENEKGDSIGYIGEGENVSVRIRTHDLDRDWWDTAVIITSSANQLNKAHVKYLEARLIQRSLEVGQLALDNSAVPVPGGLSEADTANMEAFLDQVFLILPAVRIDYFLQRTRSVVTPEQSSTRDEEPEFELKVQKYDVYSVARLIDGEFIVEKGSKAREQWVSVTNDGYKKLYNELVKADVLALEGSKRVFTENYAFRSPSAAGAVVTGRPCNGRIAWKLKGTTMTYAEWEEQQLAHMKKGNET